jgi:hypothetical protein
MARVDLSSDPVIDALLRYDLERFGASLGLYKPSNDVLAPEVAVRALNLAEQLSRVGLDDETRNLCLTLCGLVWEHRNPAWEAVPSFLIQLLSRLGLGPTTTMVDPYYDKVTLQHGPLGSFMAELEATAYLIEQEVLVGGVSPLLLSKFQKDLWDGIDAFTHLAVSAPTSAGKSFVLVEKIADLLLRGARTIAYIVPTLSLVHQVTRDIRRACLRYGLSEVVVSQSYTELPQGRAVYVLTQERAASSLVSNISWPQLDLLIVDEIQNIERVSSDDEERARILYNALQDFLFNVKPTRVVISGPRLTELNELAVSLLGRGAKALTAELPPVVSLTYTFRKQGRRVHLRQYTAVRSYPQEIMLDANADVDLKIFGQKEYKDGFYAFLRRVVQSCQQEGGTVIFSPTTDQARKTAEQLSDLMKPTVSPRASELATYIEQSVHPKYSLASCVRSGTAFHHGKLPLHLRHAIERAFSTDTVSILACTTTLMQGVNLPAKSIVARNPNLFIREKASSAKLTNYEFANLRGRAGRLMQDFVGRAIVLDEEPFEAAQITFDLPDKEVRPGYGERFENNRSDVVHALTADLPQDEGTSKYGDLIVHVRHSVLRYGGDAERRLRRAGISFSPSEFAMIRARMDDITLPQDVLDRCSGWDPLVLQEISDARSTIPRVPVSPFERGFDVSLRAVLVQLAEITPYYYEKYLGIPLSGVTSLLISARRWSAEEPLSAILTWSSDRHRGVEAEDIENRLELIQRSVMYDLPKLLRPAVLMQNPDNPILSYMEQGAHRPETRMLIQQGLAREPARVIVDHWRRRGMSAASTELSPRRIPQLLIATLPSLNSWERDQVEDVFPLVQRERAHA